MGGRKEARRTLAEPVTTAGLLDEGSGVLEDLLREGRTPIPYAQLRIDAQNSPEGVFALILIPPRDIRHGDSIRGTMARGFTLVSGDGTPNKESLQPHCIKLETAAKLQERIATFTANKRPAK
jgi:hypothetical protein